MTFERMFSPAALREFEKPPSELAEEAVRRDDWDAADGYLAEMAAGSKPLHVLGLHTLVRMWGRLRNERGEAATAAALERIAERLVEEQAKAFAAGDERGAIEALVAVYRNQPSAVLEADETEEAVEIVLRPCGSGGVLIRQQWAEREPDFYAPFDDGVPVMCRGCKALQAAFNRQCGPGAWTTEPASDGSGACSMRFRKSSGAGRRLFADSTVLTHRRLDLAREQVARRDPAVTETIHEHHLEWRPWHDFMLCWLEYTFALFHESGGYAELGDAFLDCYESVFYPRYAVLESWSDEERLRRTAWSWHYHQGRIRIAEEEHRFVIVLDPCGSGARLFRGDVTKPAFRYDSELAPLTEEKTTLSFNRSGFPLYCSHCAATNQTQIDGLPLIFLIDGHAQMRPGMACRQFLYKKGAPRVVEEAILAQIDRTHVAPLDMRDPSKKGREGRGE